ncbi:LOW QUALITY PROTEIN: hypothetical protein ACHAWO_007465 [Cyclotella atomus]|uniref:Uncharacterized protein n=1 Tax=Cyclotella atomus TaxID=382360 RepID=A0ABD3P081_9STRA
MKKYSLELIECFRGTNCVESYHKNLTSAFGKWSLCIEMSGCLLAERRHRHKHKCAELLRLGTPFFGHYNTWDNDQLQNLTKENHDIQLYDYIDTDESFDTIALHNTTLHKKLVKKRTIGRVKLTREQQHISNAVGTPLPLLPMARKDEYEAYAKYILGRKEVGDFNKAAEDWLEYVDGVNIMPKLPSHLRTYHETFTRNLCINDCMKRAGDGTKKLKELNAEVSPTNKLGDGAELSWKEPAMPSPMPEPAVTAMHTAPFRIIGGTLVGKPPDVKVIKKVP